MSEVLIPIHDNAALVNRPVPYRARGDGAFLPSVDVHTVPTKFRDPFADLSKWDVVKVAGGTNVGSNGMTASVSGGVLTIATGTTSGDEILLTSKQTFILPMLLMVAVQLSARIANQEFRVEVVSCDPVTGVVDGPDSPNPLGTNAAAWMFDGTTGTNAKHETDNNGTPRLASAAVTVATTSSYALKELELTPTEVWYHDRAMDSVAARANSYVRQAGIPDPNATFKIRIRAKNTGTPSASVNYQFQFVTAYSYNELTAEITSGRGAAAAGQGVPVSVAGPVTVTSSGSTTPTSCAPWTANYSENTAAIAAGATFTGTARDLGTSSGAAAVLRAYLSAYSFLDQPSEVYLEQSWDNTNWFVVKSQTGVAASTPVLLESPLVMRYARVRVKNTSASSSTATTGTMASLGTRGV